MPSDPQEHLVPGRACGECTVCCVAPAIDSPEFSKTQGVACPHCVHAGCGIYSDRPPVCRTFYCHWRRAEWLDDSWRPDRSHVLLRGTEDDVPRGYASATGIVFDILGPCDIVLDPKVIEVVGRMINARIPTFLSVLGLPGRSSGRVFLNEMLATAVGNRDGDDLGRRLVDGYLLSLLYAPAVLGPDIA